MTNRRNIILQTDSYKLGAHWQMLPPTIEAGISYGEARSGAEYPFTLFYGFQAIIMQNLVGARVTQEDLDEAKELSLYHLGSENAINIQGWQTLIDEFEGKLPLEIKAVKEGAKVPVGNVLFTIQATDPRFDWLRQYVEGILMKVWRPMTIATKTHITAGIIKKYLDQTSDNADFYKFAFHDFGYRSGTTEDDSEIANSAILVSTMGTDTPCAMRFVKNFYGASYQNLAFSCPATEHGVAMPFGKGEGEDEYLQYQMQKFPDGILSIVADTYGVENFVSNVVRRNKDAILQRRAVSSHPLTKLVVRPDSPRYEGDTPWQQCVWIVGELSNIFGHTINSKGYKLLNPAVGVIYGDGLSQAQIEEIYCALMMNGWDCSCMVVGQGGGALESKRDTQRMAIKPCAMKRNGVWEDVIKDPQDKTKKSKSGLLKLIKDYDLNGKWEYKTINQHHPLYYDSPDELETVFLNGELTRFQTFGEIRELSGFLA